jgi:hypothetical protein
MSMKDRARVIHEHIRLEKLLLKAKESVSGPLGFPVETDKKPKGLKRRKSQLEVLEAKQMHDDSNMKLVHDKKLELMYKKLDDYYVDYNTLESALLVTSVVVCISGLWHLPTSLVFLTCFQG